MNNQKTFYNELFEKKIVLYEYEEICFNCKGSGLYIDITIREIHPLCHYCWGKGKINWIDKIKLGVK